jgi:ribosomal protein L29
VKIKEIREMKKDELEQLIRETEDQIFTMRAKRGMKDETTAPVKIRGLKKTIARAKTMICEKERVKNG